MATTKVAAASSGRESMEWYVQKRTTSTRYIKKNAIFRDVKSETHDQKIRPTPLKIATIPTRNAAVSALAFPISWRIGDAWLMIDKPDIVLTDMSRQMAHHCQVPSASPRV